MTRWHSARARPAMDRILDMIEVGDGCWNWVGGVSDRGYARVGGPRGTSTTYVHRLMYETFVGRIPDGLTIDHLCKNRRCQRPSHLEAVTARENALRGTSPNHAEVPRAFP